ncbi:MAG: SGNH/GDSL hydrolase family protein [Propionibacterium sp.]|nr:SGNH/GDSL hydrolase family protein [Propionibacterium sp.]
MRSHDLGRWSVVGLVILGVVAVVLSLLALRSTSGVEAEPAPPPPLDTQAPAPAETDTEAPVEEPTSEAPEPAPTETESTEPEPTESEPPAGDGPTVVVIGDSHSIGDDTWVDIAADELGWGDVVNLSSPGRGYLAAPRSCDFEPCANFGGSVDAIAEAAPDLVITFGGFNDGDYSIADPAASYFATLRDALPDAELVGIAPVTSTDEAAYWLTLHARSINAALGSVDGVFVDPGQPGVGDGDVIGAEAQAVVAAAVIDALD